MSDPSLDDDFTPIFHCCCCTNFACIKSDDDCYHESICEVGDVITQIDS